MVKVSAFEAFDMNSVLDFSLLGDIAEDFSFLDNINLGVLGTVLQDIAAYEFQLDGPRLAVFGGRGFSFINGVPVAGTVTAMVRTNGSLADDIGGQSITAFLTGFSVSTADLATAVASAGRADDAALVARMFAGNDRFDLSEEDDSAFGLAGNDKMYGNGADDTLFGGDGNDSLFGGTGDDLLEGGNGSDVINGGAGSDTASYATAATGQTIDLGLTGVQANGDKLIGIENLSGSAFADVLKAGRTGGLLLGFAGSDQLTGGARADVLSGGTGKDTLTGGGGKDVFLFDTAPKANNVDTITDFKRGTDSIVLLKSVYKGLPVVDGQLDPAAFLRSASATAARDADDRIIYNTTTGTLFFDVDGVGGKAAVAIAKLGFDIHPGLVASDLFIV